MLPTSLIKTAEETHGAVASVDPVVVGAIALGILLALLFGLLSFGKGREHC
jgi:hypothetical protein